MAGACHDGGNRPNQVRARWGRDHPLEMSLELGTAARSFSTLILTLDFPDRKSGGVRLGGCQRIS